MIALDASSEKTAPIVEGLRIENWGRISYLEAWVRQKELLQKRIAGELGDTLVFCEHDAVITLGRGALRADGPQVLADDIPIIEVERGGLATYHGPGQVVAYPIFQLGRGDEAYSKRGVHNLIRSLELWVIAYLKGFGLAAGTVPGKTGVWIDDARKIASIGIAARHWVSYHGIALNIDTGIEPWTKLNPCGFSSTVMTDLQRETGQSLSFAHAIEGLLNHVNALTVAEPS